MNMYIEMFWIRWNVCVLCLIIKVDYVGECMRWVLVWFKLLLVMWEVIGNEIWSEEYSVRWGWVVVIIFVMMFFIVWIWW